MKGERVALLEKMLVENNAVIVQELHIWIVILLMWIIKKASLHSSLRQKWQWKSLKASSFAFVLKNLRQRRRNFDMSLFGRKLVLLITKILKKILDSEAGRAFLGSLIGGLIFSLIVLLVWLVRTVEPKRHSRKTIFRHKSRYQSHDQGWIFTT